MTLMNATGSVGKAIEDYTGCAVSRLEYFMDPVVPGVFAFQAILEPGSVVSQFIVKQVRLLDITADDLEEVEFCSWPPITLM